MAKFASLAASVDGERHDYGNVYFRQPCGESQRLVIGPSRDQVKLLDLLAATFPTERYYLLYVLLISHAGRQPGRYESPLIESHEDLQVFIWTFQEFLEGDGRHHLWVATPDCRDLLVYDHHDVIFAYGNLDAFADTLRTAGFREADFWFPYPHSHSYEPSNVVKEDDLMGYFDWKYFELQPGDAWED